ncbi:MAG: hypothetical protein LRY50_01160 [Geovibrio sp.]|nr:hypothetical protein [Geovibrio sp.]
MAQNNNCRSVIQKYRTDLFTAVGFFADAQNDDKKRGAETLPFFVSDLPQNPHVLSDFCTRSRRAKHGFASHGENTSMYFYTKKEERFRSPFSYPSTDKTLILSVYLFNKLPLNLPLQKYICLFADTLSWVQTRLRLLLHAAFKQV